MPQLIESDSDAAEPPVHLSARVDGGVDLTIKLPQPAPRAPPAAAASAASAAAASSDIEVSVGTSADYEADPELPEKLAAIINAAYTKALTELLPPGGVYQRTSPDDIENRLDMGDAGVQANRVLHIARRGGKVSVCRFERKEAIST